MARTFKVFTGSITKINAPYFAEKRGLWVMMVKENDRWMAIKSRDGPKIQAYHEQLQSQRAAANLGVKVQATSLEGNCIKAAEFSAGMLQQAKIDDPRQMMNAVESHLKAKQEAEFIPSVRAVAAI